MYNIFMSEEMITLTSDDVEKYKPSPDWQTQYLEQKQKPVWEEVLTADGQEIKLTNYDSEFSLTEGHKTDIDELVAKARALNPQIPSKLKRIVFADVQPESRYSDEEKFPFNGTVLNTRDGILLYKRAQRRDLEHRTGVVNNFVGTSAHEMMHLRDDEFSEAWREKFGWFWCSDYPADWSVDPAVQRFRNKTTGDVSPNSQFTTHPETCVSDYARLAWDDDYADSGVVAIYQPDKLQAISSDKLNLLKTI